MQSWLEEAYHHRVFGAVGSLVAHFQRPEWHRMQNVHLYLTKPSPEREKAMAAALGVQAASEGAKGSRADNSDSLMRADALRWLDYRVKRLGCDEARAYRDLLFFWATEFHKSVMSLDFPDAWKGTPADKLYQELKTVSEAMIVVDKAKRDYPGATYENATQLFSLVYELHLALDDALLSAIGGASRPVLTRK